MTRGLGVRALAALSLCTAAGCELGISADDLLAAANPGGRAARGASLDEGTVAQGLKEALRVGTQRTVTRTSVTDGYFRNPKIRIPMPEKLEQIGSGLRRVGFAAQVDAFELSMNRAAEAAAGEATEVFLSAVRQLTIQDALGVLRGPDDAATQYLRRTSSDELVQRFSPIVDRKLREVGAVRAYDSMMARMASLPTVVRPSFDLRGYVTDRAVGGLFQVLAEEELRIRQDPSARATDLLRKVFGS